MKVARKNRDGRWQIVQWHPGVSFGWAALVLAGVLAALGVVFAMFDISGLGLWIAALVPGALGAWLCFDVPRVILDPNAKQITLQRGGTPEGPARFLLATLDAYRPERPTGRGMQTRRGEPHFRVRLVGGDTLATTTAYRKRLPPVDADTFAEQVLFELARERGNLAGGLITFPITVTVQENEARRVLDLVADVLGLVRVDLTRPKPPAAPREDRRPPGSGGSS